MKESGRRLHFIGRRFWMVLSLPVILLMVRACLFTRPEPPAYVILGVAIHPAGQADYSVSGPQFFSSVSLEIISDIIREDSGGYGDQEDRLLAMTAVFLSPVPTSTPVVPTPTPTPTSPNATLDPPTLVPSVAVSGTPLLPTNTQTPLIPVLTGTPLLPGNTPTPSVPIPTLTLLPPVPTATVVIPTLTPSLPVPTATVDIPLPTPTINLPLPTVTLPIPN